MINTISDLLQRLKVEEQKLLKHYDIVKHPGIIGDIYEGFTKEILNRVIFSGLNLYVRAGKIRNSDNVFSDEIDCMIVVGEGEVIPYTDKFIYDSSKVIAVIQVKKNLYTKDIKDSHENLRSVIDITEIRDGDEFHGLMIRDSWRSIVKEELPKRFELPELSPEKQMLYHTLVLEAFYPARIVWGYNGFISEFSLRESFVKYIESNQSNDEKTIKGFGPLSLPNLIICDQYSIIKTNGIPFSYPIETDNWWPFYCSSYKNPVYYLLEIIWTRLSYMFGLSASIFGDDLKYESLHGFLFCKFAVVEEKKGWVYHYAYIDKMNLEFPLEDKDWEPVFLDEFQYTVIMKLCELETIDTNSDHEFKQFISDFGLSKDEFISNLITTGLVDFKNGVLKLITEKCLCGIAPNGELFAGDNKTGRVTRWLNNQIQKKREG